MNSVKYVEWLPLGKPLPKMIGEKILHSCEYRLELFLYEEARPEAMLYINFEDVYCSRFLEDGSGLRTITELPEKGWVFVVENSKWIKWLKEESLGIRGDAEVRHYFFRTHEYCFEVLADEIPRVSWENRKA